MAKRPLVLTALAVALLVGIVIFLFVWKRGGGPDTGNRPGFREEALVSGIRFRMNFLPSEQGANFKINLYDHGAGVAVGDFDGDGFDDVYFVNQMGPNALYRNKGDGTFEDVTERAGVALGDRVCVAATFADYNNDGLPDLYVTSTRGGNVLFKNLGGGKFKDVTKDAGLELVAHSQTAAFFDFDNDGHLDLLVTNTAQWTLAKGPSDRYFPGPGQLWDMAASPREHNVFYRNNGNGSFTDVTGEVGLKGVGWGGDIAVFDYDGDGYLDVFVTNMFGASQLYRNVPADAKDVKKGRRFVEVTKETLGRTSWGAIGCKAFDFNNDGKLDLFVTDMHSDMWLPFDIAPDSKEASRFSLKKKYQKISGPGYDFLPGAKEGEERMVGLFKVRYRDVVFGNTLFKWLPGATFIEVSERADMETWWPWGVATGDFDNDGFEDVFIPAGMGYPYGYWPNSLMMNNGDETFTDRAAELGIEPRPDGPYQEEPIGGKQAARSSRAAAVADFDGDGRLDLVVNNFNDRAYYFRNRFPKKNHVAFRLTGTVSNRDAVGALVTLHIGKELMVRQVHAAGGYLSQSSLTVHFGLGDRAKVDRAVIRWPRGRVQEIEAPAINRLHRLTEPKD